MKRRRGFQSDEQQAAAMARLKGGAGAKRPKRPLSRHATGGDALPRYDLNTLRSVLMAKGPASFFNDVSRSHERTGLHTDAGLVASWLRDSGRADVIGVDTPGSEYPSPKAAKSRASFGLNPIAGDLLAVEVKGSTRRRITPELRERRQQQIMALQKTRDVLKEGLESLEEQGREGPERRLTAKARKELQSRLRDGRRALRNVEAQLQAFESGTLLIMGRRRDRRLVEQYADLLRESFELDPRSMDVAAIIVGTTQTPNATGYTHPLRSPGPDPVTVPFIAVNNRYYDLKKPLKDPESRRRRLTMIHEAVHVLREHESGRTAAEAQHVKDHGQDKDREEAHTVLETQLHAGRHGNRSTESYYSFIPDVPDEVGAEDNRRARAARAARRIKSLKRINEAMQNVGKTHITRLRNERGRWGARSPENVDRVFKTSDGDVLHVHNEAGFDAGNMESFVDGLDGDVGDEVWEYHDGRLGPVAKPGVRP